MEPVTTEPLRIVCFKWRPPAVRRSPSTATIGAYGPEHVNRLYRAVREHLRLEHEFVCVTDDAEGLDPAIRVIPLWDQCLDLGGCYNRLYVFSPDMRELIGPRFACIDLDSVVTGDLTPLFDRPEEFVIAAQQWSPHQAYSGTLFMMDAGARARVWDEFARDPAAARQLASDYTGTDQAWIRHSLGLGEATWGRRDGVHEALLIGDTLPPAARIVFFSGDRDPSHAAYPWVRQHYYPERRPTFACVLRSGGEYHAGHVAWLQRQVERHYPHPHRFVCLADVDVDCERIPLEHDWPGWWAKLELFKHDLGRVFYLDLDTVIVGDLTPLVDSDPTGGFAMLRNMSGHPCAGSGVMAWTGPRRELYEAFAADPARHQAECVTKTRWGDQGFIQAELEAAGVTIDYLQDRHPGAIARGLHVMERPAPPPECRLVVFNGKPRPWETRAPWIPRLYWQTGPRRERTPTPPARTPATGVKLAPEHVTALCYQRTQYLAQLARAYETEMRETLEQLRPHLPARLEHVLDIGCGLAGIDLLLARAYPGAHFTLLDRDGFDTRRRVGWAKHVADFGAYNHLAESDRFLHINGVQRRRYATHDIGREPFPRKPFDLVISLLSWCFHYPADTYAHLIRLAPGGVLIVDVRRGTDISALGEPAAVVHVGEKHDRLLFRASASLNC
jgi:SAM-dependent methyltransferase